jgi:hypothetical protein
MMMLGFRFGRMAMAAAMVSTSMRTLRAALSPIEAMLPIFSRADRKPRKKKRRAHRATWGSKRTTYHTMNGARECERRIQANGALHQEMSHMPPALWPRHIGVTPWIERA